MYTIVIDVANQVIHCPISPRPSTHELFTTTVKKLVFPSLAQKRGVDKKQIVKMP
jgi:hypothetical protein